MVLHLFLGRPKSERPSTTARCHGWPAASCPWLGLAAGATRSFGRSVSRKAAAGLGQVVDGGIERRLHEIHVDRLFQGPPDRPQVLELRESPRRQDGRLLGLLLLLEVPGGLAQVQLGEADVDPVDIGDDVAEEEERDQASSDLGEKDAFLGGTHDGGPGWKKANWK